MPEGLQDVLFGLSPMEVMERMPRRMHSSFRLSKREPCADAIPGTTTNFCSPGATICCVHTNTSIPFPQCESNSSAGFCCVDEINCYIDTVSDCTVSGATQCSLLATGVTHACCPPFTTCPSNFTQSATDVRCNLPTVKSSSTTSSLSSSVSATSSYILSSPIAAATPTSSTPSITQTPLPVSQSNAGSGLSTVAATGLGVTACLFVIALAVLGFWLYKRGQQRGLAMATLPKSPTQETLSVEEMPAISQYMHQGGNGHNYSSFKAELPSHDMNQGGNRHKSSGFKAELPAQNYQGENRHLSSSFKAELP